MRNKKTLAWFTLFAFFFSVGMGVMAPPKPALAGGEITEMADQIAQIYGCLDEVEKDAIKDARTQATSLTPEQWKIIVNPLLTQEVKDRFGGDANIDQAENELVQFAKDMSLIYYPADGDLENYLNTINANAEARASFQTLMGYSDPAAKVTFSDLINLAKRAKELTPGVIKGKAEYFNAVTSGTDAELAGKIYNIGEEAIRQALNENAALKAKLLLLGWNASHLRDLQQRVSNALDPNHQADIALLYGYVRTTTTLHYNDGGDTAPANVAGDPNTYYLEPGKSVKAKVLGREIVNVGISLRDNNYNEVSWAGQDLQGYPIVPAKPGNYTVVGFRNAAAGFVERAWILKRDVVILGTLSSDANLAQIKLDGSTLAGFNPATASYLVTLEPAAPVPVVTAVASNVNATFTSSYLAAETSQRIVVTAQDGTSKTYLIKFAWKEVTNIVLNQDNLITMDSTSQNLILNYTGAGTVPNTTVTITVPPAAANPTITAATTTNTTSGKKEAILPKVNVTTQQAAGGGIELQITGGTVVTGPDNWDGTLALPQVLPAASAPVPGAQSVDMVIDFGMGDADITFNPAIRLLIPGAKDQKVGYIKQGQFWAIDKVLPADSPAGLGNPVSTLPHGGDGYFVSGADKAIWTKHATEFLAFTPAPASSGGGGGGGVTPTGTLVEAAKGGTVASGSASLAVPANALAADARITIEKVSSSGLALTPSQKLVSDVYNIAKDKAGDLKQPVTVTIGFDPGQVDTAKYDLTLAWYDTANSRWVKLNNVKVDLTGKTVKGESDRLAKFAVIAEEKAVTPPEPTTDLTDIKGHWAYQEIVSLVDLGILAGYTDKTFRPNKQITRAEFATVLVKALQLEAKTGKVFGDTRNHWAQGFIATANAYGIISGYSDSRFGPDDLITREQMAVMLANALKLEGAAAGVSFTDANSIRDWAKDAVAAVAEKGLISGYTDGSFKPGRQLTRAEAASVTIRALNSLLK